MPTDIYNRIVEASENADAQSLIAATKELEQRIKTEARTIRDKYIDPPKELGIERKAEIGHEIINSSRYQNLKKFYSI